MAKVNVFLFLIPLIFLHFSSHIAADRPCAARQISNRSVVCVCNMTYCDDITRDVPGHKEYITYTSSASGLRFQKGRGFLRPFNSDNKTGQYTLNLDPNVKYQKVKGFGGAVTDSAAINWKSLPESMQQDLIDSYFSKKGLEYNIVRVPIGCCDFSVRHYTYDDFPGDDKLEKFALQKEDIDYKIPMIKKIFETAGVEVYVIGSYWTPPAWMKYLTRTNPQCGYLKREYYQTFAEYLLKFVESYEKEGITIWSITTGNEPSLSIFVLPVGSCLGWPIKDLGDFIVNNLGPTFRNSTFNNVNILALDDQRYTIKIIFEQLVNNNTQVLNNIQGIAIHYYANDYVSPNVITHVIDTYPNLFVISTEASAGVQVGVKLGSWKNAKKYIKDMIENLAHDVSGWVDWNLCLDMEGGPNVDNNFVDSPVIVNANEKEFYKQPMYYALGHITKFVPRGSIRIKSWCPCCDCCIPNVGFLTPYNTIVVIIHNVGDATSVSLRQEGYEGTINLEADSITTIELLNMCGQINE